MAISLMSSSRNGIVASTMINGTRSGEKTVLTVTMNPSVDITYPLDFLEINGVNRVAQAIKTAGGKGLNVTRVLNQLGDIVLATGLIGGSLGAQIKKELRGLNIETDFFEIAGDTRNCIAILHEDQQTELLESGPTVTLTESQAFLAHFNMLLKRAKLVVISGSLPKGVPNDYYVAMIECCQNQGIPVILDCAGENLKAVLTGNYKPLLIKPNNVELAEIMALPVSKDESVLTEWLSNPLFRNIEWVIVSLGSKGALVKHNEQMYRVIIPKIEVKNPVGSGDSTIAGLASAIIAHESDEGILKKANTLGMLNALEEQTGQVNMKNFDSIYKEINIEKI